MIILGIDPGNVRAGYGVVKKEGGKLSHLESGLIKIPVGASVGEQLLSLEKNLDDLVTRTKPDFVGLEKVFLTKNKKTAILVTQARGLIIKVLAAHGVKTIELSPPSIKLAVTGNGQADKKAVAKMTGLLLGADVTGLIDDATDALATAIAASSQINGL